MNTGRHSFTTATDGASHGWLHCSVCGLAVRAHLDVFETMPHPRITQGQHYAMPRCEPDEREESLYAIWRKTMLIGADHCVRAAIRIYWLFGYYEDSAILMGMVNTRESHARAERERASDGPNLHCVNGGLDENVVR